MSEKILFVFEGKKTEPQIFKNLNKEIFKNKFDLYLCYGSHIYSLYNKLKNDKYLDIVKLLREDHPEELKDIFSSSEVSAVYLFFDYDPQSFENADEIIPEMLEKFNNETEYGKLFISYPMVEAIKDCSSEWNICAYQCNITNPTKFTVIETRPKPF
ncbi:RloB domain-containing protein [Treponema phagedenis]|uniref:RloB domain-containing protein n=1 Tax=Treponema phagedenis TaxID=162 RepID=UPI000467DE0E|nr:RloB domain-containing protein [Treponema phagedenis]QEJ95567.1 hypothetical protein FUT79_10370 [Treponema phagedenis]QEK01420.1 hypothetical protein FUT84_09840 [Treponema phagedenis]QEK06439.1 hypothetical protein FUT80_06770 [Treponema phagedenis]